MASKSPTAPELEPLETWAAKHATPAWLLAATKAYRGWPIGREVSEAEYLAAVERAAGSPIGATAPSKEK